MDRCTKAPKCSKFLMSGKWGCECASLIRLGSKACLVMVLLGRCDSVPAKDGEARTHLQSVIVPQKNSFINELQPTPPLHQPP